MNLRRLTDAELVKHGYDMNRPEQAFARHFIDEDTGDFVTELCFAPINYKDPADGKWKENDNRIETEYGFGKKVKKAKHNLRWFTEGKTNKLRVGFDKSVYVDYTLPAPVYQVDDYTMAADISDDLHLKFTSILTGVKTEIILDTLASVELIPQFPISLRGAVAEGKDGIIYFNDSMTGEFMGMLSLPFMTDAAGEVGNVSLIFDGESISYQPDIGWLLSPDRVYPVAIDPTTTNYPGADTYVRSDNTTANYDTGSTNYLGKQATKTFRTFFQPQTSTIPAGMVIVGAELNVYVSPTGGETLLANLHRVTSNFYCSTVTWATQPTYDGNVSVQYSFSTNGGNPYRASITGSGLTAIASGWYTGAFPNYGIMLKAANEATTANYNYFSIYAIDHSSSSYHPRFYVSYTAKPTVSSPIPGNSNSATPEILVTTTPTLSWSFSDTESGTNQSGYQVIITRVSDGAIIKDTGAVASAIKSYTVPAGILAQSTKYKWKVRAYDADGGWSDYSQEMYIYVNKAPYGPTNLSPNSNQVVDAAEPITLSWTFQDDDIANIGDAQTYFQLLVTRADNGTVAHDSGAINSSASSYTIPANTLINGVSYQWKVRTWDSSIVVGAYSSLANFRTGTPPTVAPLSPANGGEYDKGILTVTWDYNDAQGDSQATYSVRLLQEGVELETSGELAGQDTSYTFTTILNNNDSYQWEVVVTDSTGQESSVAVATFTTVFAPPAKPIVDVSKGTAKLVLTIINPPSIPSTVKNHIYKKIAGAWVRIAKDYSIDSTYEDYHVESGVLTEYMVVAVSDAETTNPSDVIAETVSFKGAWLHDINDPAGTLYQFGFDESGRGLRWQPESALVKYAGRTNAVAVFGESEDESISATLLMKQSALDYDRLNDLIRRKSTLCYRDGRGRKIFGSVQALPVSDEMYGYSVSIEVIRTSYTEAV